MVCGRLSSSSFGTIGYYANLASTFVVGLAQRHDGRVARTDVFEVVIHMKNIRLFVLGAQKLSLHL